MVQALTANYYATVTMVDDNVGRLLEQLEDDGAGRQHDHRVHRRPRQHAGRPGRWFKGVAYEGSTRIPLLMKAPAGSPLGRHRSTAGKVVTEIVENIDVMPTLLRDDGPARCPKQGIQGKSLVGLVAGTDNAAGRTAPLRERGSMMIRTPQYKLIKNDPKELRRGEDEYELYDLVKDPGKSTTWSRTRPMPRCFRS